MEDIPAGKGGCPSLVKISIHSSGESEPRSDNDLDACFDI